jgi:hypothetical protein
VPQRTTSRIHQSTFTASIQLFYGVTLSRYPYDPRTFEANVVLLTPLQASALQSFALGAGHKTKISHYVRSFPFPTRRSHQVECNTFEASVWRREGPTNGDCLWQMHGVWGWDAVKGKPVALRESYFTQHPLTGRKVCWRSRISLVAVRVDY